MGPNGRNIQGEKYRKWKESPVWLHMENPQNIIAEEQSTVVPNPPDAGFYIGCHNITIDPSISLQPTFKPQLFEPKPSAKTGLRWSTQSPKKKKKQKI